MVSDEIMGTRIVERLFKSESYKEDVLEDETPAAVKTLQTNSLQRDNLPDEGLPIKDVGRNFYQTGMVAPKKAEPITGATNVAMNGDQPHRFDSPPPVVQPANETTDKPETKLSVREAAQMLFDEKPAGQGTALNNERKPNKGGPKRSSSKVQKKKRTDAQSEELVQTEQKSRSEELVVQTPSDATSLLKLEQATAKHSTIYDANTLPLKRSRKQKPKAVDEPVTDEELAELEAENAGLKLLLYNRT
ncbi:hypothetical protein [Ochrobactrum sp. Marseille-Q0166]|uniref:hypothetical protein n=1 Tax=Ochrobactrum sp. Marseille-Q0166 TaxID=2761105 RepID=UPI0016552F22|nr:hypothetical protein [Ochrobactrum sp. Marseille-Q0166]MBC8719575.1 hypothetical protein [Ochrobactrum sp. Marseille-Q0166]